MNSCYSFLKDWSYFQKFLHIPISGSSPFMFSSNRFKVSGLISKSLVSFNPILVQDEQDFLFYSSILGIQLSQHYLRKKLCVL